MPRNQTKSRKSSTTPRANKTANGKSLGLIDRIKRASWPLRVVFGTLTFFGGYTGWLSIQPRIDVKISHNVFDGDTPTMIISNSGYISARNLTWDCGGGANIYVGPNRHLISSLEWETKQSAAIYSDIGTLKPGAQVSRRCRQLILPDGSNMSEGTVIIPYMQYTSLVWPIKEMQTAVFALRSPSRSYWYWESLGETLSEEESNRLEREGYELRHFDN